MHLCEKFFLFQILTVDEGVEPGQCCELELLSQCPPSLAASRP